MRKERYSLLHLFPYWQMLVAIGRIKCPVIAICTPAASFAAIAVGTCKTAVKGDFLYPAAKQFPQISTELVIIENILANRERR